MYQGRRFLTKQAKEYKETVAWEVRAQYRGKPINTPVRLKIALWWPDKRRHDLDNIKGFLDAMTGILYEDDSQIVELTITKAVDRENPRVVLELVDKGDWFIRIDAILNLLTSFDLTKENESMKPQDYTESQISDIQAREAKGIQALKDLELTVSAQVISVNVGDNTFAQKVVPYLSDMKFTKQSGDVESPIEVVEGKAVEPVDESAPSA